MTSQINSSTYYRRNQVAPTFADISVATVSQTALVSGVSGTRIMVLSMTIGSTVAQDFTIQSASTTIGTISTLAGDSHTVDADFGVFVTEDGEDLNIVCSSATAAKGSLSYIRI